jgi:PIN domain nuclease of toxin-antitoxin system
LFDASALLAFVLKEPGTDVVHRHLVAGGRCGAANWSEVAQKISQQGNKSWFLVRSLLLAFPLQIEPVTTIDAERAAALWVPGSALSLADRLCLALGERLDAVVWTADTDWGSAGRIRQIR